MKGQNSKKEESFEAALKRLEEIVSEMEKGELSLQAMLKRFDEGMRLAHFCSRKLEQVEKKIEVLVKKEDEGFETREFSAAEENVLDGQSAEESLSGEESSDAESEEEREPLF